MSICRKLMAFFAILTLTAGCKQSSKSSIKGDADNSCEEIRKRISQAETSLKNLNAQIPIEANSDGKSPELTPNNRNCDAEGVAAWRSCMRQKCDAYNITAVFDIKCATTTDLDAAVAAKKINDADASCAKIQGQTVQFCSQQSNTQQPLEYVCAVSTSADGKTRYNWLLKTDAIANKYNYIAAQNRIVYPGTTSGPLNDAECAALYQPASNLKPSNPADAKRAQDIAGFTTDLEKSRKDLKLCLDQQKAKITPTPVTPTPTPTPTPLIKPSPCPSNQYRDASGNCVSDYSQCKDGHYMGDDGRCYPNAERPCDPSIEYLATDGKCYPLGDKKMGDKTSCPSGQVLTNLKTCEPDSTYSDVPDNFH